MIHIMLLGQLENVCYSVLKAGLWEEATTFTILPGHTGEIPCYVQPYITLSAYLMKLLRSLQGRHREKCPDCNSREISEVLELSLC